MPALPKGFWVATTKKGSGSWCVTPSTVTWRSSIGSRSAACVRGDARFTSSTSTTFANTGPGRKSHVAVAAPYTEVPVTSAGSRSGVHCTRP